MDSHGLTEQLHFLIKCLETEMPEYAGYTLPVDPKQAFDLYRALCNVRMPSGDTGHTLPDDFYTVQSEALQNITEKKGITDATALSPDSEAVPSAFRTAGFLRDPSPVPLYRVSRLLQCHA